MAAVDVGGRCRVDQNPEAFFDGPWMAPGPGDADYFHVVNSSPRRPEMDAHHGYRGSGQIQGEARHKEVAGTALGAGASGQDFDVTRRNLSVDKYRIDKLNRGEMGASAHQFAMGCEHAEIEVRKSERAAGCVDTRTEDEAGARGSVCPERRIEITGGKVKRCHGIRPSIGEG